MKFSLRYALSACAAAAALAGCDPKDGMKELEQGRAAYELRDLKKAEKLFEKSVACAATNVDVLVYLARVKLDLGELDAAKEWVEKAAALAGHDLDVRILEAQIAWHAKDYAAAAALFSGIAGETSLGPEACAQGWVGLGIVEMAREQIHLARVAFLRAIHLDQRNAAAWYHLGLLYRDNFGYLDAALEQFDVFVHVEAAADQRVQKVQRTVIPELKDAITRAAADRPGVSKRDSAASAAAIAKGDDAMKKGNFKLARQHYQTAFSADPLSYPAAMGLAQAWLKSDATRAGQLKALECYRNACTLSPGSRKRATFLAAGALAEKLGMSAQAVEIYSRAVAAVPKRAEAIDGLIRSLRRVGGQAKNMQAYQGYRDAITGGNKKK